MKILLIMAMQQEAQPIMDYYAMQDISSCLDEHLPIKAYAGKKQHLDLHVLLNGTDRTYHVESVGTIPATLSTYLGIKHFQPEIIINAGTAGAFANRGAKIGDVYLSHGTFKFHDRRIPLPGGYEAYGIGSYSSHNTNELAQALSLKQGMVSTGDSFDLPEQDLLKIQANEAILKDMEAAAIAYVTNLFAIPMFAIKSVTDLLDVKTPPEEAFLENLQLAASNLQHVVEQVLDYYAEV